MNNPIIESPRELAEFLVNQTNFNEAPQGTVFVIDLDTYTGKVTQVGFTAPNANPNEMISHINDNRNNTDDRVIVVPLAWNEPHTKDVMSVLRTDCVDVLTIDPDRQVFWSLLCDDTDCCPPEGQSIYQIDLS